MKIQEIWSIPVARIREFLQMQDGVRQAEENCFLFGQCRIMLTTLPDGRMGSIRIPKTQVEFEGQEEDTEAFHKRFVLQFLSAGG